MFVQQIGDREEIKAIEKFCENRGSPLKVSSVKSNMGHAEAASTLCSLAKVIIAMKSGVIPPNINYKTPRNDIDALHNGLIEVSNPQIFIPKLPIPKSSLQRLTQPRSCIREMVENSKIGADRINFQRENSRILPFWYEKPGQHSAVCRVPPRHFGTLQQW